MKFNKELIRKAHKLTKEIKKEYPEVDYRFQFGICLKYLLSNKEENKLRGSEKQVTWAEKIRAEKKLGFEKEIADLKKLKRVPSKNIEKVEKIFNDILAINDASKWIDIRNVSVSEIMHLGLNDKLYMILG